MNVRTVAVPFTYSVSGFAGLERTRRNHSYLDWTRVDIPALRSDSKPCVVAEGPGGRGPRRLAVIDGRLAMRLAFPYADEVEPDGIRAFLGRWNVQFARHPPAPRPIVFDDCLPFLLDGRAKPLDSRLDDVREREDCDRQVRAEAARLDARRRLRIVDGKLVRTDLETFVLKSDGTVLGIAAEKGGFRFVPRRDDGRLFRLGETPTDDPRLPTFSGDLDCLRYRIDGEAAVLAERIRDRLLEAARLEGPSGRPPSIRPGPNAKAAFGRRQVDFEGLRTELHVAEEAVGKAVADARERVAQTRRDLLAMKRTLRDEEERLEAYR